MANVKILLALAPFASFLVVPALVWRNSSRQPRYNVTLDLVNTSRRTTGIFWNFTALGVMATNCTKEIRPTNDTDSEMPGWSYSQETNGTNKNRVAATTVNPTSKTKSYWIYSNNPADVPSYDHPFVFTNGGGANRASKQEGYLSKKWEGFSHIGYEPKSLPTKHLSTSEVLKFRGEAFYTYQRPPAYLDLIRKKFGEKARKHVEKMLDVKIKRRTLGD